MKIFFKLMLGLSILSGLYQCSSRLGVMAHSQYTGRYELLKTEPKPYQHSSFFGLTPTELAKTDDYVANAYRNAVYEGYKLGIGYDHLSLQCLAMTVLLFLSSVAGLRALRKK